MIEAKGFMVGLVLGFGTRRRTRVLRHGSSDRMPHHIRFPPVPRLRSTLLIRPSRHRFHRVSSRANLLVNRIPGFDRPRDGARGVHSRPVPGNMVLKGVPASDAVGQKDRLQVAS